MVKNTIGGKKGKMLANKRMAGNGGNNKMRLSLNEYEIYVCVSKTFGGGMFEVINNEGKIYRAILRGKMKGPNKRHNFVSLFSILLIGIRSDLSDSNDCDILFVYDDHDILSLSLLPNLHFQNILSFHMNQGVSNFQNDLFIQNDDHNNHIDIKDDNHNHLLNENIETQIDFNLI